MVNLRRFKTNIIVGKTEPISVLGIGQDGRPMVQRRPAGISIYSFMSRLEATLAEKALKNILNYKPRP
jgi:hypothetical protein